MSGEETESSNGIWSAVKSILAAGIMAIGIPYLIVWMTLATETIENGTSTALLIPIVPVLLTVYGILFGTLTLAPQVYEMRCKGGRYLLAFSLVVVYTLCLLLLPFSMVPPISRLDIAILLLVVIFSVCSTLAIALDLRTKQTERD